MANSSYTVSGFAELRNSLRDLQDSIQRRAMIEALEAAAEIVVTEAKANVPVDTGKLKSAITYDISEDGQTVRIGANYGKAPHAHLVELGTAPRKLDDQRSTGAAPAQPFLRPAFDDNRGRIIDAMADVMRNALRGRK